MKWPTRLLTLALAALCCFVGPELIAQEGSEGSGTATTPKPSAARDRLMKSIAAYEKLVLNMANAGTTKSAMKIELLLNASNAQGQAAKIGLNLGIKSDVEKGLVAASLGGDLGNALAIVNAGKATVLLPDFDIYSTLPIDPTILTAIQAGAKAAKDGKQEDQVKEMFKGIRKALLGEDLKELTVGKVEDWAGEKCDTLIAVNPTDKGTATIYISKTTDFIRGVKVSGADGVSGSLTVDYNKDSLPVMIAGKFSKKDGPDAADIEVQAQFGWKAKQLEKFTFRLGAKMKIGTKFQFDVRVKNDAAPTFGPNDFVMVLDPDTQQEVEISQIGQSLMMGAMGKLMQLQMLMQPAPPEGAAPGPGGSGGN